jgi:hypothetical protein
MFEIVLFQNCLGLIGAAVIAEVITLLIALPTLQK